MDDARYYREFALAYVRGMCPDLGGASDEALLAAASDRELRLHRFKRTAGLPRVRRVIGALKSFAPRTLLDVGSGRGVFLWPLLDAIDEVEVTAIDTLDYRVADLEAVHRGGVERLRAELVDAAELPFDDDQFDAVTVLEVLEHVADPWPVARRAVRVARTVVIATVPAKEDNNPEHIRLFTLEALRQLFIDGGAREVAIEHVRGHLVALVKP